jgi:hypothetical protein
MIEERTYGLDKVPLYIIERAPTNSVEKDMATHIRELLAENAALKADAERVLERVREIGDYAHDKSTGPAVPDALWEIRRTAYEIFTHG